MEDEIDSEITLNIEDSSPHLEPGKWVKLTNKKQLPGINIDVKSKDDIKRIRKRKTSLKAHNTEEDYKKINKNSDFKNKEHDKGNINQGRISSLFGRNPEIPVFSCRVVKPVSEHVFSSQDVKDLPIHPHAVSNLDYLGLQKLTTVQQKSIPLLLDGKDALIRSQTGSGKTLAYAIPIIEKLQEIRPKITRSDGLKAVVIVPTRELALQTHEWFIKLVKPFTWIVPGYLAGGEKRKAEKRRLSRGLTLLVSTPGRLLDHIQHTKSLQLDKVKWLVLDEADRLFEMGYQHQIARFTEALKSQQQGSSDLQTVLLSATLTSAVEHLAGLLLKSPTFIDAAESETMLETSDLVIPENLIQYYILTPPKLRLVTLSAFIIWKCKLIKECKIIIFCSTPDMVNFHTEILQAILVVSESLIDVAFFKLHGSMKQEERTEIFKTFRAAESGVLLCTDVAARGLELPHVDWIVQYTAPSNVADYVHRVGRTARIGTAGSSLLFLAPSEVLFIRKLEERRIRLQEEKMDRCLEKFKDIKMEQSVEAAATSLQMQYERAVLEDKELHELACKAYISWVRFYASYNKEDMDVFSYKALHLGHYAKSFALRDPPTAIGGIGRRSWQKKMKTEARNATRPHRKKTGFSTTKKMISEFDSGLDPVKRKKFKK